jgi:hypothetical protein
LRPLQENLFPPQADSLSPFLPEREKRKNIQSIL